MLATDFLLSHFGAMQWVFVVLFLACLVAGKDTPPPPRELRDVDDPEILAAAEVSLGLTCLLCCCACLSDVYV